MSRQISICALVVAVLLLRSIGVAQPRVDCTTFAGTTTGQKIQNCINSLTGSGTPTPTGGIADATGFGNTGTYPASSGNDVDSQITVGTSVQPVQLLVNPATTYNINVTGGGCAIAIANGSSVVGVGLGGNDYEQGPHGGPAATFYVTSSANISSVFCNTPRDGTDESFWLEGVTIQGSPGSTVTDGLILIDGVGTNSGIRNVYTQYCNAPHALYLTSVTSHTTSDLTFDNVNFDCTYQSSGAVVWIGAVANSTIANVVFRNSPIQHPGSGQALLAITGNDQANGCYGIHFRDQHFEVNSAVSSEPVTVQDCQDVAIDGMLVSGTTPSGMNSFITLSESASDYLSNFRIENAHVISSGTSGWVHVVNNTIDGTTHQGLQYSGAWELGEYTFRFSTN
jgi:hypothetical protein